MADQYRIEIDLNSRRLGVEGPKEFVETTFERLLPLVADAAPVTKKRAATKRSRAVQKSMDNAGSNGRTKKTRGREVQRLTDLNLRGAGDVEPLDVWFSKYGPKTHYERNLVFTSYLVRAGHTVTADHIYTCYYELGESTPTAFFQSLRDTASRRKWLAVDDLDDITVTINGENYLLDLAKRATANVV